jgi:LPS export ABC transporter protein LptC
VIEDHPALRAKRRGGAKRRGSGVTLLTATLLLLGCGPEVSLPESFGPPRSLPPIELEDVVFEGFSAGNRGLRVEGERATIDASGAVATLDGVTIAFAGSERGDVNVRAARAVLDLAREDVVLEGGVRGQTAAGERFRTERVRYERASGELVGRSPVELERHNLRVEAGGMRIDTEGRRLVLEGDVRTRIAPEGPGG